MSDAIEWGGWALDGKLLTAPRRAWLRLSEARLLRALMLAKGKYVSPAALMEATAQPTLVTMRTKIATLRDAVGKESLEMSRDDGYRLLPAYARFGTTVDPIDDLVKKLTDALAAAKRVQTTINEDRRKS